MSEYNIIEFLLLGGVYLDSIQTELVKIT